MHMSQVEGERAVSPLRMVWRTGSWQSKGILDLICWDGLLICGKLSKGGLCRSRWPGSFPCSASALAGLSGKADWTLSEQLTGLGIVPLDPTGLGGSGAGGGVTGGGKE